MWHWHSHAGSLSHRGTCRRCAVQWQTEECNRPGSAPVVFTTQLPTAVARDESLYERSPHISADGVIGRRGICRRRERTEAKLE
jgi:hypothetical protein